MPAPIPATYPAEHVITEDEWNAQIRDTHRESPAVKATVANSIWFLETAGVTGILPPPPAGSGKKILSINGAAPFWDTPAPTIPPSNSVSSSAIQTDAVKPRHIDTTNSPADDEVLAYKASSGRLEYRLARIKEVVLDTDTSGSVSSGVRTFSESSPISDGWDKYIFYFVRAWTSNRCVQSPLICLHSPPSGLADDLYADFRISDPYLSSSDPSYNVEMEGYIRIDRSANRVYMQVKQSSSLSFTRVELCGIRHRVAE